VLPYKIYVLSRQVIWHAMDHGFNIFNAEAIGAAVPPDEIGHGFIRFFAGPVALPRPESSSAGPFMDFRRGAAGSIGHEKNLIIVFKGACISMHKQAARDMERGTTMRPVLN
jgi:hypothetical protein